MENVARQRPHIMELIANAPWREAVTYRETWPHEYVVVKKDGQEELLAAFCERIERGEGVECQFFHQRCRYLFLDDYKYWIMVECSEVDLDAEEEVLNRERLYRDRRDFVIQSGDTGRREDLPGEPGVLARRDGPGIGQDMTDAGRPSEVDVLPKAMPVDRVSSWKARIRAMENEWEEISERQTSALLADWNEAMSEMRLQQDRLVSDGLWVSGPSDFLDIIGLARNENTHSRMLEWLLRPTARHGLGCGLVRRMVERCTGEPASAPVAVRRVVFSYWRNGREADLVVWGQDFTLSHREQGRRARARRPMRRFVRELQQRDLATVPLPDARRSASPSRRPHLKRRRAFTDSLVARGPRHVGGGIERIRACDRGCRRRCCRQKLPTHAQGAVWMNSIENEQIKFYFQHEERIREWANLETEVFEFVDRFYRSLKGDLDAALREREDCR